MRTFADVGMTAAVGAALALTLTACAGGGPGTAEEVAISTPSTTASPVLAETTEPTEAVVATAPSSDPNTALEAQVALQNGSGYTLSLALSASLSQWEKDTLNDLPEQASASAVFEMSATITNTTAGRNTAPEFILTPAAIYSAADGPDGCEPTGGDSVPGGRAPGVIGIPRGDVSEAGLRTLDLKYCLVVLTGAIPGGYGTPPLAPDESVGITPWRDDAWPGRLYLYHYSESEVDSVVASGAANPLAIVVLLESPQYMYDDRTDYRHWAAIDPAPCVIEMEDGRTSQIIAATPSFSCADI